MRSRIQPNPLFCLVLSVAFLLPEFHAALAASAQPVVKVDVTTGCTLQVEGHSYPAGAAFKAKWDEIHRRRPQPFVTFVAKNLNEDETIRCTIAVATLLGLPKIGILTEPRPD